MAETKQATGTVTFILTSSGTVEVISTLGVITTMDMVRIGVAAQKVASRLIEQAFPSVRND